MTDKLTVFDYNKFPVTVIQDEEDKPWWIVKEVCKALSLSDVSMTVRKLADDEKLVQKIFVSGQRRDVITVNEPGLYALIMRSNKKEAVEFRRWITHKVLPEIMHTGSYNPTGTLDHSDKILSMMMKQQDAIIQILQNLTQTREQPSTRAIPHVTQENSVTDLSGEEVFPIKKIRKPFGKNNPLYRKLKEKGHWMTVTMVAKEKLQGQVSFETCRRAIYDGSVNIRPTIFFKICGALDFTREEIIKIMRDYGYTDFVDMLEGI